MINRLANGPVFRHRNDLTLHQAASGAFGVPQAILNSHPVTNRYPVQNFISAGLVEVFEQMDRIIGLKTKVVAESREITVLADKSVPFDVIKKVMSTATGQGYGRISLAVLQKAPKKPQT